MFVLSFLGDPYFLVPTFKILKSMRNPSANE